MIPMLLLHLPWGPLLASPLPHLWPLPQMLRSRPLSLQLLQPLLQMPLRHPLSVATAPMTFPSEALSTERQCDFPSATSAQRCVVLQQ